MDTVIGGHTHVVTWNDFKEFTEFYSDFFTNARSSLQARKSVDETATAYRVPARFQGFVADAGPVKANVQAISDERRK